MGDRKRSSISDASVCALSDNQKLTKTCHDAVPYSKLCVTTFLPNLCIKKTVSCLRGPRSLSKSIGLRRSTLGLGCLQIYPAKRHPNPSTSCMSLTTTGKVNHQGVQN
jgi:hypothetical protein